MSLIQRRSFRVGSSFPAKREARHPPNLVPVMTPVYGVALLSPAFQRNPVSPITRPSSRKFPSPSPRGGFPAEAEKFPGKRARPGGAAPDHSWLRPLDSRRRFCITRYTSAFPHYGDATQNGPVFGINSESDYRGMQTLSRDKTAADASHLIYRL